MKKLIAAAFLIGSLAVCFSTRQKPLLASTNIDLPTNLTITKAKAESNETDSKVNFGHWVSSQDKSEHPFGAIVSAAAHEKKEEKKIDPPPQPLPDPKPIVIEPPVPDPIPDPIPIDPPPICNPVPLPPQPIDGPPILMPMVCWPVIDTESL